jgi:hypothetical protein
MSKLTAKEVRKELHNYVDMADAEFLKVLYKTAKRYLKEAAKRNNEDQLYRMVYTSARPASCDNESIQQILEASRRNNPVINVTGMLLHTEDRFIQILEGSLSNITALYEKIAKDKRHGGSMIRYCEPTTERLFGDWHMAEKAAEKDEVAFKSDVTPEQLDVYQSFLDGDMSTYKDEGMRVLKTFIAIS